MKANYSSTGVTTTASSLQPNLSPYLDSLKGQKSYSIFDKIHSRVNKTGRDPQGIRIQSNILLPQNTINSHKSILVQNLRRNNEVSSNLDLGEHLLEILSNSNLNSQTQGVEQIRFNLEDYKQATDGAYPDFNAYSFGPTKHPLKVQLPNSQFIKTLNPPSQVGSVISRNLSQTEIQSDNYSRRRKATLLTTENLDLLNKSEGKHMRIPTPQFIEKEQVQQFPQLRGNYQIAGGFRRVKEEQEQKAQASPQRVGKFGSDSQMANIEDRDLRSIQNILDQADYRQYQIKIQKLQPQYQQRNDTNLLSHTMPLKSKQSTLRFNQVPPSQQALSKPENEFQENVMHILDRSHSKYRMNISDDYIIDSQSAKKTFRQSPDKKKVNISPIIMVKSKEDRERLMQDQIKQSQSHSRSLTRNSSKKLIDTNMTRVKSNLSRTPVRDTKEDYILPDIKDYHRIVERGLERLDNSMTRNYEEWCNMVKLCFDAGEQVANRHTVNVASLELMRLHPIFNRLSFYGVRDFLGECKLVKLRANQLLYRQDDVEETTYIVVFGKVVLHHRDLGALGVVGMGQTLGEDALVEQCTTPRRKVAVKKGMRKEGAYAQSESYLLEISIDGWRKVKSVMLQSGPASQGKTDVCHIERMLIQNYQLKNLWRINKQKSYVAEEKVTEKSPNIKRNAANSNNRVNM